MVEQIRIVTVAGHRLAFVGVLSEQYAAEHIRILPPRQAILEIIQRFAGQLRFVDSTGLRA